MAKNAMVAKSKIKNPTIFPKALNKVVIISPIVEPTCCAPCLAVEAILS